MVEKILITAALPYINNVPHMGHIVGSHLPADIQYRHAIATGKDAIFIGGSDQHGTPAVMAAKQLGVETQDLVDKLHEVHKKVYAKLNIAYTNYSNTANPNHHQFVQEFFETIHRKGFTSTEKRDMYYCENEQMFLPDRYVIGTCPTCNYEAANADQCEECATVLSTGDLIDPTCYSCGEESHFKETEHVMIQLGQLTDTIDSWVESNKDNWRPHVYSEAKRWINEGLKSRSITRDMDWGVKVPLEGFNDKVFYVWFDALLGYASFTQELGQEVFESYWKNPDAQIMHFLGKDNVPFHTIFWTGMLQAHGELNLPSSIIGYNYLNFEGQKFSKSKGVGVFCSNLLTSDINIDSLRSYLTTVLPENRDSDFKWDSYQAVTNNELLGKIGNFFNRTLNFTWKNFNGNLNGATTNPQDMADISLVSKIHEMPGKISTLFEQSKFRDAYKLVLEYASEGNRYLERKSPWKTIKTNPEKAKHALYLALQLAKSLTIVANPILPETMNQVWTEQLGLEGTPGDAGRWAEATKLNLPSNHPIHQPTHLYEKITDERLEQLRTELSKPHSLEQIVKE
mgnify:CR=1 FL=1